MRKKRTYDEYIELGQLLYSAHESLVQGYCKAGNMFPLNTAELRQLEKAQKALDAARKGLDNNFCSEYTEHDIPPGSPKYPMYPGASEKRL